MYEQDLMVKLFLVNMIDDGRLTPTQADWIFNNMSWLQLQSASKPSEVYNLCIAPLINVAKSNFPN